MPGALAEDFVTWSLQLRRHKHARYELGDLLQQRKRVQLEFTPPLCYNRSLQETFNLWRLMHARCLPRTKRPLETVSGIGRKERHLLSKAGVCAGGVESHGRQASVVAAVLWEQLSGSQHVLWLNNFYRWRFRPMLVSDDVSLNCSVATVLAMPWPLDMYTGPRRCIHC